MSHDATNWAIKQRGLKPATKLVLWHLADCHNAHTKRCDPKQATLADMAEMSRASVNRHLQVLEDAGLIRRIQRSDKATGKQISTYYQLGLDHDFTSEPPKSDPQDVDWQAQDVAGPCLKSGHGSVSQKTAKPCLKNRDSRVSNCDTNPVKEPGKKPMRAHGRAHTREGVGEAPPPGRLAVWVDRIRSGQAVPEDKIWNPDVALLSESAGQGSALGRLRMKSVFDWTETHGVNAQRAMTDRFGDVIGEYFSKGAER